MAKFFQITGVSKQTSRHTGKDVYAVFFKADTGESYKTWIDPANSNFRRWQNLHVTARVKWLCLLAEGLLSPALFARVPAKLNLAAHWI
jgi:hypothetical protein